MRYLGGKARIAKWVTAYILKVKGSRTNYVEPFLGSAAVFEIAAPYFETSQAYDLHPDLMLMWQALVAGWKPPPGVTRSDYERLRHEQPSPLRGLVGFGASFNGIWFNSYVSCPRLRREDRIGASFYVSAKKSTARAARTLARASLIERRDYHEVAIPPNSVVYCDPPYAGTGGYHGVPAFDSKEFWATATKWSESGALVVVSEAQGPADWKILAERTRRGRVGRIYGEEDKMRTERLYIKS